jgi:IclR family acetate operon transcriptional repressor
MDEREAGFIAIDRAVTVIDVVREGGASSLAQIARATGLSEPTALRYLGALRHHRIVRRDPETGAYSLGMRLFEWGESARGAYDPRELAAPVLDAISKAHGETVELASVESGASLIVLDARPGPHGVSKVAHIGDVEEWHSTSVGKALLAAMDTDRSTGILSRRMLTRFTDKSLTTLEDLQADFARIRERGYAIDDEESEPGLRCVGVAVRDLNGVPSFAISVSGPTYRITEEEVPRIARTLADAAAHLERAWGQAGAGDVYSAEDTFSERKA